MTIRLNGQWAARHPGLASQRPVQPNASLAMLVVAVNRIIACFLRADAVSYQHGCIAVSFTLPCSDNSEKQRGTASAVAVFSGAERRETKDFCGEDDIDG